MPENCPKCGDHIYSGDDECLTCRPTPEKTPEKPRRVRLSAARHDIESGLESWLRFADRPERLACQEYIDGIVRIQALAAAYFDQRERDDVRERAALIACQTLAMVDEANRRGIPSIAPGLIRKAIEQARAALADD